MFGSARSPFLKRGIINPVLHSCGNLPDLRMMLKSFVMYGISVSLPYFNSSLKIVSCPGAFLSLSLLIAVDTSSAEMLWSNGPSAVSLYRGIGLALVFLLRFLKCEWKSSISTDFKHCDCFLPTLKRVLIDAHNC